MAGKAILYYTLRSPPCRSVLLTAKALNAELELRNINIKAKENLTQEFLKLNPQHTIPVLNDNGTVVTDSHLICSYLVGKYAGQNDALYPKDPTKRNLVDARLYYDAGNLFSRLRFIVEPVIHHGATNIPEDRISYMQRAYDGLEHCLAKTPYLAGSEMTIADLCTVATISSAALFAPINAKEFPKLNEWLKRMQTLPYYKEANQEGSDQLYSLVQTLLAERQQQNKA